jgi:bifunctional non-homologous end joining protein LigD
MKSVAVLPQYSPMHPTLVPDGWRILAYKHGGRIRLLSRNRVDHARRFRETAAAVVARLPVPPLVLDGEVAIFDEQLRSRFDLFQHSYIAFDLLYRDGSDLSPRSLRWRRARLEEIVTGSELVFPVRRLPSHGLEA